MRRRHQAVKLAKNWTKASAGLRLAWAVGERAEWAMQWLRRGGQWALVALRATLYLVFTCVSAVGLYTAWATEGTGADRDMELRRLRGQLLEANARGLDLRARVDAFDKRPDVRMQMIRTELGLLRPAERIYLLK